MARKLNTYRTSIGFYDLVIAAPSMKAALDAWGANSNLFHQGFAHEVDDEAIAAAALKRPGVILKRPVGTDGSFTEHPDLPADLPRGNSNGKTKKPPKKNRKLSLQKMSTTTLSAKRHLRSSRRRKNAKANAVRQRLPKPSIVPAVS